jgi:hypothetical protein
VNTEPKFICEACTKAAGAEFLWQMAKAIDAVDCLYYTTPDTESLRRMADMLDHCLGQVTESWRRIADLDL